MKNKWIKNNKKFLLKSAVLAGTSFLDYYLTDLGISMGKIEEINPVIDSYVSLYGEAGPYFLKGITTIGGIFGMYLSDIYKGKIRIKSDHIFYIGTFAYSAAALSALGCMLR